MLDAVLQLSGSFPGTMKVVSSRLGANGAGYFCSNDLEELADAGAKGMCKTESVREENHSWLVGRQEEMVTRLADSNKWFSPSLKEELGRFKCQFEIWAVCSLKRKLPI